jgi:hypothetical protein
MVTDTSRRRRDCISQSTSHCSSGSIGQGIAHCVVNHVGKCVVNCVANCVSNCLSDCTWHCTTHCSRGCSRHCSRKRSGHRSSHFPGKRTGDCANQCIGHCIGEGYPLYGLRAEGWAAELWSDSGLLLHIADDVCSEARRQDHRFSEKTQEGGRLSSQYHAVPSGVTNENRCWSGHPYQSCAV